MDKVAMLPTPSVKDQSGGAREVELTGTSWTRKGKDKEWSHGAQMHDVVKSIGIGVGTKLRLQPAMVEWMMGFPEGWTEIPDSKLLEMRLSRKLQKK
jgi:hypothetical protein